MLQYSIKRFLLMIPTLFGITFVTFMIIRLAPGDPVTARFGVAGVEQSTGGADGEGNLDREKQILKAKVRLGLMREVGTLRAWDPKERRPLDAAGAHEKAVQAVTVSPDGEWLASAAADGVVRLWRPGRSLHERGAPLEHDRVVRALAFGPDGQSLAVAGDDKQVRIYRLDPRQESASLERVLEGHDKRVTGLAFHPGGELIASSSADKTARVWRVADGHEMARMTDHYMEVTSLVYTPDGRHLITGGRDRQLLIWDTDDHRKLGGFPGVSSAVHALALDPDGQRLAAGLGNNTILLWRVTDRRLLAELEGHKARVTALAFHPAGDMLASGSQDKSIRVWNLKSYELADVLTGHTSQVNSVVYSVGGGELYSASLDTLKVHWVVAYGKWLWKLVRLDLGRSFKDGRPVREKILTALPITLKLNLTVILFTYLFSIPIGLLASADRNGLFDQLSSVALFLLYSMPSFWVGTMLIIGFGGWLETQGLHTENAQNLPYIEYLWDHLLHLVLPIVALAYGSFAFLSRLARTSMLDVLELDFVRTARSKGLPESKVVGVHAFRNALIPIVTVLGNLLPALIGGSVIIEVIFGIPGMGRLGFEAITQRDYPVTMAITTLVAVLTMLGILISDILYCLVDPRIQLK